MSGGIGWVVAVNLVIWTGLFLYLLWMERRVRELEQLREPEVR
jgi:CcmD family protein